MHRTSSRPTGRTRWPKGTYMRVMKDRLLAFVSGPDRKMSARELSHRARLSPSAIYQMTRQGGQNTVRPETATRIAEVLEVPVELLFDPVVPSTTRRSVKRKVVAA